MNKQLQKQQPYVRVALRSLYIVVMAIVLFVVEIVLIIQDYHFIIQIANIPFILYFIYKIVDQAYDNLRIIYKDYRKYNKLHRFDEKNTKILPFKQEEQHKQSTKKSHLRSSIREPKRLSLLKSSIRLQNGSLPKHNKLQKQGNIMVSNDKNKISEAQQQKVFLQFRQKHKAVKRKFIQQYSIKQAQFQERQNGIKTSYISKLKELLILNEKSLKDITNLLEKNYEIKIVNDDQQKSEIIKLVPITIDQAIFRMDALDYTKCMPWSQRKTPENLTEDEIYQKIKKSIFDRKIIDRYLSPYHPIKHKMRINIINQLQRQLQNGTIGREFIYTVIQIYNDTLKNHGKGQSYLIFQEDQGNSSCLEVIEQIKWSGLHVNLLLKRNGTKTLYNCTPGQNNLWSLMNFAYQIYRLKI